MHWDIQEVCASDGSFQWSFFHPGFQFCQPTGWRLSTDRQQPTFTVAVLTDSDADRHYCACLTFHETVAMTPTKPDDSDGDEHETNLVHHSLMFAPKSLVLISRLDYFETFRVSKVLVLCGLEHLFMRFQENTSALDTCNYAVLDSYCTRIFVFFII